MQFMISVDVEGCACVVGTSGGTLNESKNLAFALKQATREADACARALFDGGATRVIVIDSHGAGVNLDYDSLDRRCDIVLGSGQAHRLAGLTREFAGLCLVGYHAMDDTSDAVIAHTFSSAAYQWLKINGRPVGEMAVDAACAGALGVPVIFVASDDKGVKEAREFFPWVQTVSTKVGLGWNAALSKHPARVCEEIYAETARAVARRAEMRSFEFHGALQVEMRYKRLEAAEQKARSHSGWERVDAYTVRKRGAGIGEFY